MHLPPLLPLLLASLSLSLTHASAHHAPRALHPRAPSPHHHPSHHPPPAHHHARSARPIKTLHKRLWYSPICTVPEPESPEGSLDGEEHAASPPTPPGIPIPRSSPLGTLPRPPSTPRVGSMGRVGSTGSFPRPGLSRTGSSGLFLQGEQLKAYCMESCTCKKVGQMPAELSNHGIKHCGSRCQGVCHCGENR